MLWWLRQVSIHYFKYRAIGEGGRYLWYSKVLLYLEISILLFKLLGWKTGLKIVLLNNLWVWQFIWRIKSIITGRQFSV